MINGRHLQSQCLQMIGSQMPALFSWSILADGEDLSNHPHKYVIKMEANVVKERKPSSRITGNEGTMWMEVGAGERTVAGVAGAQKHGLRVVGLDSPHHVTLDKPSHLSPTSSSVFCRLLKDKISPSMQPVGTQ